MTDQRSPPYPAKTKAKGWRFELDIEQVMQSDTWALAKPQARPWLLMLWVMAWQQVPCGSMPADDELIIARLGIDPDAFAQHRKTLMRGWWQADDGRLYHPTITQRVLDMLGRKDAERTRKAEWRARKEAELKLAEANALAQKATEQQQMSHGTDLGQTWESHGSDDTGTGTGTGTGLDSSTPPPRVREGQADVTPLSHGTDAGRVCKLMKACGIPSVNPGNQDLIALIAAGATDDEFRGAATEAAAKGNGFAYALAIVSNSRQRAAALAKTLHRGPLPAPPPPTETAHARKMRETAEGLAPGVAKRSNAPTAPTPLTIDLEAHHALAIGRH